MCPGLCSNCDKIYDCYNNDLGAKCFLCTKKMCEDCCPQLSTNKAFMKVVFPICGGCSGAKKKEVLLLQETTGEDSTRTQDTEDLDEEIDTKAESDVAYMYHCRILFQFVYCSLTFSNVLQ